MIDLEKLLREKGLLVAEYQTIKSIRLVKLVSRKLTFHIRASSARIIFMLVIFMNVVSVMLTAFKRIAVLCFGARMKGL
jgi:hypothetical protein